MIAHKTYPCDLHVLATPPAFVLSQDQTLQFDSSIRRRFNRRTEVVLLILTPPESGMKGSTHSLAHTSKVLKALQAMEDLTICTFVAVFGYTVNL